MRWWLRILVTLVLAPLLWQLGAVYLGSAQGGAPDALVHAALASLPKIYLIYTLPALAVVVLCLIADRILALLGLDLLIVAVAPALAVAAPVVLSHLVADPRLEAAGLDYLAFAYGLVFGLTVREPRAAAAPAPAPEASRA